METKPTDILTFREFCSYADISTSKGYKAIHNNELPYYKPKGGKVYLKIEDIRNYMLQGRVASKDEIMSKAQSISR